MITEKFNWYRNIYTPKVKNFTTINEWFNLIQESQYTGIIKEARKFEKGTNMYDSLKATLPAITYNFTFHTNKENQNISGATGLLYIDVDELTYDINSLDKSKIFAYYRSFGGKGYSVLVQVNDLNKDNYEATYSYICTDLGLLKFQDKGAKKKTQFNVMSYDPDIYINYDSFVFSATEYVLRSDVTNKRETYTSDLSTTLSSDNVVRFNNLYEQIQFEDYDCIHNLKDGWQYVSCWIPFKKVKEGKRNNSLLSYCNNLVWLNPHLTFTGAYKILKRVNNQMCEIPVDDKQIKSVVTGIFNGKDTGTLKPIVNIKNRKIVFAPYSLLTKEEKFAKCRELVAEYRTEESKQKLYNIIEDWDFNLNGKITIRAVVRIGKMGTNTVQKYWPEFKEYVAEMNEVMGCVKASNKAIEQPKETNDMSISTVPEMSPEALHEVAYNFNDAGFNLTGVTMFLNATNDLSDNELVKLVLGIEDLYHNKPVGEVAIEAGGLTYKFINDATTSMVKFKGIN